MKFKVFVITTVLATSMVMTSCGNGKTGVSSTAPSTSANPISSSDDGSSSDSANTSATDSANASATDITSASNSDDLLTLFESFKLGDQLPMQDPEKPLYFDASIASSSLDPNLRNFNENTVTSKGLSADIITDGDGDANGNPIYGKEIVETDGYKLPEVNVTVDMFNSLKNGMTEDQVIGVLGQPTLKKSEEYATRDRTSVYKRYNWWSGSTYDTYKGISVLFKDGVVSDFQEIGLVPEVPATDEVSNFKLMEDRFNKIYIGMSVLEAATLFKVPESVITDTVNQDVDIKNGEFKTYPTVGLLNDSVCIALLNDYESYLPAINQDKANEILSDYKNGKLTNINNLNLNGAVMYVAGTTQLENVDIITQSFQISGTKTILFITYSSLNGDLYEDSSTGDAVSIYDPKN